MKKVWSYLECPFISMGTVLTLLPDTGFEEQEEREEERTEEKIINEGKRPRFQVPLKFRRGS